MLIPIISVLKLLATLTSLIVAKKSYDRWKETNILAFEYFSKGMFWLSICFATFVFMPVMSEIFGLRFVQGALMLTDFSGIVVFAYFAPLTFIFLEIERFHLPVKRFIIGLAILVLIIEGYFFKEAIVQTYPIPFLNLMGIGWTINLPILLKIWFGIVGLLFTMIFGLLLIKKVLTLEDPFERKKGIFVTIALFSLGLAAVQFWFLSPMSGRSFWMEILQGLLSIFGPTIFAIGMLAKKK